MSARLWYAALLVSLVAAPLHAQSSPPPVAIGSEVRATFVQHLDSAGTLITDSARATAAARSSNVQVRGTVIAWTSSFVSIEVDGRERAIPTWSIERLQVRVPRSGLHPVSGFVLGGLIGGLAGGAVGGLYFLSACGGEGLCALVMFGGAFVGAGVGSVIGLVKGIAENRDQWMGVPLPGQFRL